MNSTHSALLADNQKLGDLISVRHFPSVVQAADIRALRQTSRANSDADSEAVADFTGGYLGVDEATNAALQRALRALCGDATHAPGGAFFLNGVFGAGKSHFLGVLGLLAQKRGLRAFALSNPQCAPLVGRLHNRRQLALHIALDEYDGERWSLEAIFWRELALEWKRAGCEDDAPNAEENLSRREQFSALEEALIAHEFDGLVVCWDELSLFLAAREHRALQADAAWLQFLGQRARPPLAEATASTCRPSLCVFAALQKTVEDIGGIETYSLQQIRDRFQTLSLATAHIPALIERRLIQIRDEESVARVCRSSFQTLSSALPRLEFGPDEWRQLVPFHPPIIALLEQCVARFLSRTRSAAIFCAQSIDLNAPAQTRVGITELFDYLHGELDEHPELRALGEVWRSWENELASIAQNAVDEASMRRVMQALIVFKIAGIAPDATQIAHAIALDANLPHEGNYAWAQVLAERLRARGGHLAVERHNGEWSDRWTIDVGVRAGEAARRALQNVLEGFAPDDARVWRHALNCCRQSSLPLRELEEARSYEIFWHHAPRRAQAMVWRAGHEGDELAARDWTLNRIALLSQPAAQQAGARDELLILLAHGEVSRALFHQLREQLPPESQPARVALWLARRPTDDEWRAMSEACGAHLLADDPQLLDNRRGRAVLAILQNEGAAYDARTAQIMERLWREGELMSGDGGALEASELTAAQSWTATLEAVADWLLPNVFPLFESVAPRARVLTPGNADQLGLEILRRPAQAPFFAPSLERLVRYLAAPLGVAIERDGRWMIALPDENLRHDLESALQETGSLSLNALYDQFARNEWGLVSEQMQLAVCALLRGGQWLAIDARGAALSPLEIGLPLRRSVHSLREGALLEESAWRRVQSLLQIVAPQVADGSEAPNFSSQQDALVAVREWAANARGECELMRARWHQLRRQIGGQNSEISNDATPNARWANLQSALENVESVLHAADSDGGALQVLAAVAPRVNAQFFAALHQWQKWRERFDARHANLVEIHAYLTHETLVVPPGLQAARQELLGRLAQGEDSLLDETLPDDFASWRREYSAQYAHWHQTQHDAARWTSLERLAARDDWRAVERLSFLQNADFSLGDQTNARQQLEDELEKRCARDGSLDAFPVCASCRLRWNQRLNLRVPAEFDALLETTRARLQTLLQNAPTRERLQRQSQHENEVWLDWNGELASLATISPVALQTLDEALRPRRRVARDISELNRELRNCHTRDECAATFAVWLDGGQALRGDDEIEWSD